MIKKGMIILAGCLLLCTGCSAEGDADSISGIEELGRDIVQESSSEPENTGSDSPDVNIPADVYAGGSGEAGQTQDDGNVQPDFPIEGDSVLNQVHEDGSKPMDIASVQNGMDQFQGMEEIQYAGGDRILLFADRIYLYELTGQRVIAEAEYPDNNGKYGNLKTWITDSGYCMAYETISGNQETQTGVSETVVLGGGGQENVGSNHIMYAYYDADLGLQKTIDVTALGADVTFIHETAPSRDGGRIAVCEWGQGISLYDVNTMAKMEILRVDGKNYAEMGGLCSVNQVAFAENDSRIVFLGDCIENGEGYICYGSVKTDGSGLAVYRENTFDVMSVFAEHTILSEELPDDRTSGQIWVYYPSQEMSRVIQLSEKIESSHAWGSDKGNYCITAVRNDNVGWTLRLYDIRTTTLVSTKVYEVANTDDYREPHICYLEDQHTAVLLQRPYGDNKQYKAGIVSFQ